MSGVVNMKELRKPACCPRCKRNDLRRIVGGRPNEEGWKMIDSGDAVPGDCFLRPWKEDWRCVKCGHEWCDKTDPARIKFENLAQKIIDKNS